MNNTSTFDAGLSRRVWLIWLLVVIATFSVTFLTLPLTPTIWQDEVQILDFGRLVMPGADESYSITWDLDGHPVRLPTYLGFGIQEVAYRICGEGPYGPRLSTVAGAIVASFIMLNWLVARGSMSWVALGCAVAFLWEPLFVEGYRGARVDSWTMAFMLLSLWIVSARSEAGGRLKVSAPQPPKASSLLEGLGPKWWQVFAGLCVAVAGLIWVSAILLLPLLAYEILRSRPERDGCALSRRFANLVWVGAFTALFVVLLLLPQAAHLSAMIQGVAAGTEKRVAAGIDVAGLLEPYTRSPWVPMAALLAIAYSRSWGLAVALVIAVAGVLATQAYVHRAVYLTPYYLLAISVGAKALLTAQPRKSAAPWVVAFAFAVMLVWSAGMTLVGRTYLALKQKEARNPAVLLSMAETQVGPGAHKVYLGNWELYYAGRRLGWKQFRSSFPANWDDPQLLKLISGMDYVIYGEDDPKRPNDALMSSLGFSRRQADASAVIVSKSIAGHRTANAFSSYVIYSR
jgi:hypothetical protein